MTDTLDLSTLFNRASTLAIGERRSFPHPENLDAKVEIVEISQGRELVSVKAHIDEYRTRPERLSAVAELQTLQSLIDYANRFKRPESALHATLFEPFQLTVEIDYHGQGAEATPSFRDHKGAYKFPLSKPMRAWMRAATGALMEQEEFAHFLEDREIDIHNPPIDWMMLEASQLRLMLDLLNLRDDISRIDSSGRYIDLDGNWIDEDAPEPDEGYIPRKAVYKLRRKRFASSLDMERFAQGIAIVNNTHVAQDYDKKSGQKKLIFKDDHQDKEGRPVRVPDLFLINIPVFENGQRHLLPVRLYYRLRGGAVKWAMQLIDPERMIRIAVEAAAREAAAQTGLPLFFGAL